MTAVPLPLFAAAKPDYPDGVLDGDGCWHESAEDALGQLIGLCGCAHTEEIAEDAATLLTDPNPEYPTLLRHELDGRDDLYVEVLLTMLTNADLIEHGGSVGGSWLTDLGKQWAEALKPAGGDSE